ncbi:hypothetical protein [Deinococcus sp. UYEF24]
MEKPTPPTASRHPSHLRAILTVPLLDGADPNELQLWARTLPTWTLEPAHDAAGKVTPEAQRVIRLVSPVDQAQARAGLLILAHYPQISGHPVLLAHRTVDGRGVTLRVFAHHLTELQALAESVTDSVRAQASFGVSMETRVIIAIVIDGVRHDLTSGRVRMGRGGVFSSFYQGNKYALNVTLAVLLFTLAVVLALTPTGPYTPLGKFYGLSERVLSAVLLSALLLFSQFLYFVRHRRLIAWERP